MEKKREYQEISDVNGKDRDLLEIVLNYILSPVFYKYIKWTYRGFNEFSQKQI